MKRFSVGQKVVALKDAPPDTPTESYVPYEKGLTYSVDAAIYCTKCGFQHIDIGLSYRVQVVRGVYGCEACGDTQQSNFRAWANSGHFAALEEIDDLLKRALEVEDYETAAVLRDVDNVLISGG